MIQWFPGHMAKAKREIEQNLKLVDIVIELVDARAPHASQNPMLQEVIANKPKMIALMKSDLADPTITNEWLEHFKKAGYVSIAIDVNNRRDIIKLIEFVNRKGMEEQKKLIEKGVERRAVRALIVGIPNVGKSTLINRLANKKIARIGDRPGITRQQQWIKVRKKFELLDTPGILWPKFEDELTGIKLAAIGSIKYELVPEQDVAAFVIKYVHEHDESKLFERYQLQNHEDMWDTFVQIGKARGALESGGNVNFDKVAEIILQDFRLGRIGKISLERP